MQVDPKVHFWFAVVAAICSYLAGAGVQLTDVLDASAAKHIVGFAGLLTGIFATISAVMAGFSSHAAGIFTKNRNGSSTNGDNKS